MTETEFIITLVIGAIGGFCAMLLFLRALGQITRQYEREDRDRLRSATWRMGDRRYDR